MDAQVKKENEAEMGAKESFVDSLAGLDIPPAESPIERIENELKELMGNVDTLCKEIRDIGTELSGIYRIMGMMKTEAGKIARPPKQEEF